MLVDDVTITVKAGDGGAGAVSFRRNAQTSKGGPDGGNGGNGGNVYFQGVNDATLLRQFQFKKLLKAESGIKGLQNNLYGRNGKDLVVKIPVGTRIREEGTGWTTDIDSEKRVLVASGGRGGKGNNEFKSATNQAPRFAQKGGVGEQKRLRLELRLIADIGLVGLPNAGKSSLLKALTNANPKIGDYPFTTLEPNLGVMDKRIIADIPGLIEGASKGKGLGIKFLKHIEKTKVLVHCIDSTSKDILRDYQTIHEEFAEYNPQLLQKKEIVVLTKIDLLDKGFLKSIKKIEFPTKHVFFLSVLDEELVKNFSQLLLQNL